MRKKVTHIAIKWFLLVLFTSYTGAISLFTHTHIINGVTYIHSHPFKIGEPSQHTHSVKQLIFLDTLFNTKITSDIIPEFDLTNKLNSFRKVCILYRDDIYTPKTDFNHHLRAPPAA